MDNIRVHAYTDEDGLTLFCVDFPDGHRLQFGALITDFRLEMERYDITSMLDNFRSYVPTEQRISVEATVVQSPVYSRRPTPPKAVETEVRQLPPARKELPSGE